MICSRICAYNLVFQPTQSFTTIQFPSFLEDARQCLFLIKVKNWEAYLLKISLIKERLREGGHEVFPSMS